MKLNFKTLTNLSIDKGVITGELQGKPVVVQRHSEGWRVGIVVKVDGHLFHSDMTPTEDDRTAYDELDQRAWKEQDARREASKAALKPVAKVLFSL